MNTWTEAAVVSFRELLTEIEKEKGLSGAIIISGKADNFCAGANLKLLADMTEADEVRRILNTLQDSFNRWNDLKIPTVAAINGVCAGARTGTGAGLYSQDIDRCQVIAYRPSRM